MDRNGLFLHMIIYSPNQTTLSSLVLGKILLLDLLTKTYPVAQKQWMEDFSRKFAELPED